MLPKHLKSTWQLLHRAYPSGIPSSDYQAVLAVLYPHMADENLAAVMATFAGMDTAVVLNDIYKAASIQPEAPDLLRSVTARLRDAGLSEWEREES